MSTKSDTKVVFSANAAGISDNGIANKVQPRKSSLLFSIVTVIVVIIALLSLLMSVIVIVVHQSKFQQSDVEVEYLRGRVTQLEQYMEVMVTKQTMTQQQTSSLQGELLQLHLRHDLVNVNISNLRSNLTTTRNDLSFRISQSEMDFHQLLNGNRDEIESIYGDLLDIKKNITNTQEQIIAAVNLYNNCTVHRETCTIDGITGRFFWRLCATPRVPIDMEVSEDLASIML